MVEIRRPGVFAIEKPGQPLVQAATQNTCGFVGTAERGPLTPTLVTTPAQFTATYGGNFAGSFLGQAVNDFFTESNANRLYIVRVVGTGSAAATIALSNSNLASPVDSIDVTALSVGAWGDRVTLSTVRAETTLAAEVTTGAFSSITLASVRDIEIGDLLHIDDPTNPIIVKVISVNLSTNVVTIHSDTAGGTLPIGTPVRTSSMHAASAKLTEDIPASSITSFKVDNPANFRPGQIVYISDGTTEITVVVANIEGDVINIASAVTPTGIIASATAIVASQEFYITFTFKGDNPEQPFRDLSMGENYVENYVENRMTGLGNESTYIKIEDAAPTGDILLRIPLPVSGVTLAGGLNGATPGDNDYIGQNLVDPFTGMRAFDNLTDLNFFAIPGITTVAVHNAMGSYGNEREDIVAMLDAPKALDTAAELREYRLQTVNIESSYAALYAPFLRVRDPDNNGLVKEVPPSGKVAGVWVRVTNTRGLHKSPANEILNNTLGLTKEFAEGDVEETFPHGINLILAEEARGIVINSARTLTRRFDGKHLINVRRVLNFVKVSLRNSLNVFRDEPLDDDLRDKVAQFCERFLLGIHEDGMLVPRNDPNQAFFVVSDDTNNSENDKLNGILNVAVGVAVVRPAEFIVLTVQLQDGSLSVDEQVKQI